MATTTTAPPAEESLRAEAPAPPRPALWTASTSAAVAAVMAWFAVQLGRFVGEAPDMDAMISLRESIVFHRDGLKGLIADRVGTGVHPPLMDTLTSLFFSVFGEDPRSQQFLGIVLFIALAAGTERLLVPWLSAGYRVLAALAVAITPSLAVVLFTVAREALVLVLLVVTLAIALAPGEPTRRRLVWLGAVCALFPLTKDACLVLVAPFALYAFFVGGSGAFGDRVRRALTVLALPLVIALLWRIVLRLEGGEAWHTWISSERADEGPFVVALRAMFGMERGLNLRQNLANGLIVNWLWVPALLAAATVALVWRRGGTERRRAVALIGGLAAMFTWTTLTFPTFSVPRYATPLTLLVLLIIFVGLGLWPRRARPWVVAALLATAALGAWSPTDPVSRSLWHTVSIGGERFYDTPWVARGPDRIVYNLAILRASERVNARLRRVFATNVDLVTGDCDSMKFGEKLFSVGFTPSVYDRGIPRARPLKCVNLNQLPPDAANGAQKIGLVRTIEEETSGQPLPISGKSIVVIH